VAALAWRRRFPHLFVGWFWYVGMLVPVIGLMQVGSHSMADRYTYLPHIGLCIFLSWGVAQLAVSWRHGSLVCGFASVLAVLVLMGMAWRQTSYWRDSEALWTRASACTARNYIAHYNLAKALSDRGQVDAAIAHYQKALEIKPDYAEAHNNLGLIFAGRRQSDEAIIHFQKALELKPDYASAHQNLGVVLTIQGRLDESIEHYRKALELKPDYVDARTNLDYALKMQRQP
jgi:tetratricopeptide (TPR) repeat protein